MSKDMLDGSAVIEIADLAVMGASCVIDIEHDGATVPVLVTKDGERTAVSGVKRYFDEWAPHPERREGTAVAGNLESFCGLTARHLNERSAIFSQMDRDGKSASLVAVIDYDDADGAPAHQRHRIRYDFPFSREWLLLQKQNDQSMTQVDFAEFVEDNLHLLAMADGDELEAEKTFGTKFATPAEMLTLSRGLKITAEAQVKEIRDLRSGEAEIAFVETHRDANGAPIHVPGLIMFKAPIFDGGGVHRFVARLRYRRAEGRIIWRFVLYRPVDAVRAAVEEDARSAADDTGLPLYCGAPERPGARITG